MKSQAEGQRHLIAPTDGQTAVLSDYLESIGADKNVLSHAESKPIRDQRNSQIYMKWFQQLVVFNRRFPHEIPIKFVLAHFSRKVVQNDVAIKGFNLREQVRAFHEYLDSWEHELRAKWWQYQNPGDRPKAIAPKASISEQEQAQSDAQRAQMIEKMYGAANVPQALQKFINA